MNLKFYACTHCGHMSMIEFTECKVCGTIGMVEQLNVYVGQSNGALIIERAPAPREGRKT